MEYGYRQRRGRWFQHDILSQLGNGFGVSHDLQGQFARLKSFIYIASNAGIVIITQRLSPT